MRNAKKDKEEEDEDNEDDDGCGGVAWRPLYTVATRHREALPLS